MILGWWRGTGRLIDVETIMVNGIDERTGNRNAR